MGAGAAEVDAGHGGAGREAVAPHVGRQAFALEDVAAGEANFLFDVGRPEDLGIDDRCGNVAAEASELMVCCPGGTTDGSWALWK